MLGGLWESLFFNQKPQRVTVQLLGPKDLPGFQHGGLTLIANKGDTFSKLLGNFNAYRGPDSQIPALYTQDGDSIPPSTVIVEPVVCVVRAARLARP